MNMNLLEIWWRIAKIETFIICFSYKYNLWIKKLTYMDE